MRKVKVKRRLLADRLKHDLKNPHVKKAFEKAGVNARIAITVAKLRQRAGLTQKDLATKVGVAQQVISRLEDPEKSNMTLATLHKVADALGKHIEIDFR